jgi:potassium-transporting ATPase KdpC subunit
MIKEILQQTRRAALVWVFLTVITGLVYPALVTGIAQVAFPFQANGSLVHHQGRVRGSALIGQPFSDPKYFWGRPSATSPYAYNAAASSGSNLGPTNPELLARVKERVDALRRSQPGSDRLIPVDLVTASGSGLDPHLSPAAALYQVLRIARARGLSEGTVTALVAQHLEKRWFGILGEPHVNVLELNLDLDDLK